MNTQSVLTTVSYETVDEIKKELSIFLYRNRKRLRYNQTKRIYSQYLANYNKHFNPNTNEMLKDEFEKSFKKLSKLLEKKKLYNFSENEMSILLRLFEGAKFNLYGKITDLASNVIIYSSIETDEENAIASNKAKEIIETVIADSQLVIDVSKF